MKHKIFGKGLVFGVLAFAFLFLAPSIIFSALSTKTQDELLVWYYSRNNQVLKPDLLNKPIGEILSHLNFSACSFEGRISCDNDLIRNSTKVDQIMAPVKYVIVKTKGGEKDESLVLILSKPRYVSFEEITQDELYGAHVVGIEYCNRSLNKQEVLGQMKLDISEGRVDPRNSQCSELAYYFPYILSPFDRKYTRALLDY